MAVRNVKIDGAGLTVIPSTKGSILYVGDFGLLHEDPTNLSWNEATKTLTINALSAGSLTLGTALLFTPDNTVDIGAAGANRPRTGYFGTQVNIRTVDGSSGLKMLADTAGFRVRYIDSINGTSFEAVDVAESVYTNLNLTGNPGIRFSPNGVLIANFNSGGLSIGGLTANSGWTAGLPAVELSNTNGSQGYIAGSTNAAYVGVNNYWDGGAWRYKANGFATQFVASVAGLFSFNTAPSGTAGNALTFLEQFRVAHTASAVNYLQVTGGATGNAVRLSAAGTDTNVSMIYSAIGSNGHDFYTNNFAVAQVSIIHTASSNRQIILTGSNGGNPTIDVSAGALKLSAGTSDIQWGKANVALGGGAAPTVGTIGGAGPAAAAQRNWLRFLESDGTASFIPVWR